MRDRPLLSSLFFLPSSQLTLWCVTHSGHAMEKNSNYFESRTKQDPLREIIQMNFFIKCWSCILQHFSRFHFMLIHWFVQEISWALFASSSISLIFFQLSALLVISWVKLKTLRTKLTSAYSEIFVMFMFINDIHWCMLKTLLIVCFTWRFWRFPDTETILGLPGHRNDDQLWQKLFCC